jgi:ubiquinone/menaquinone biosynthesis C-methylase UbiE
MSLYRNCVLPWLMERILSRPAYAAQRRPLLGRVGGRVLEIGFGFGASLEAYPASPGRIAFLAALEPNAGMLRRAARRLGRAPFSVLAVRGRAEALPFADDSFDAVVTNWSLCSVVSPRAALMEIRRVLRPGGIFLFLEHGRADDPRVARWQARLNRVQRLLADGCRLDLKVDEEVRAAGLSITALERYQSGTVGPRSLRQMYRGAARIDSDGTTRIL